MAKKYTEAEIQSNELKRIENEENRIENEAERMANEIQRIAKEEIRSELNDRLDEINSQLTHNEKYISNLVNVKELGVKGDGVSDDTNALQQVFNSYTDIYIPEGIYCISESLIFENKEMFYNEKGYKGRTLKMDKSTIIKITTNNHCLIVRGSNMKIEGGTITFKNDGYSSDLLRVEALKENSVCLSCNNIFDGIYCITQNNVSLIGQNTDYYGTGIHLISNGQGAIYGNRFINCYVADLNTGLYLENNSTAGINGNTFDMSIWNCNCCANIKGSGNVFSGNIQSGSPGADSEKPCVQVYGGYNNFLWHIWDVGQYPITNKYAYKFVNGAVENVVIQYHPASVIITENYLNYNNINTSDRENNYITNSDYYNSEARGQLKTKMYYASALNNALANRDIIDSISVSLENMQCVYGASYKIDDICNHNFLDKIAYQRINDSHEGVVTITINTNSKTCVSSYLDMLSIFGGSSENGLGHASIEIKAITVKGNTITFEERDGKWFDACTLRSREFYRNDGKESRQYFGDGVTKIVIDIKVPTNVIGNSSIVSLHYLYANFGDLNKGIQFSSGLLSKLGDKMNGNLTFANGCYPVIESPNGSKFKIQVDDAGAITTIKI